jgi:uncharacterized membrane protein
LLAELKVDEHIVAKHLLNNLQVSVWVVGVRLRTAALVGVITYLGPFLLLLGALLEEHFSQNVFLLLMTVIILHIVVVRLIKD